MNMDEFIENVAAQYDDASDFTPETNFRDVEGWCSLVALSLISMIDEEYGVSVTGKDIRAAATIQDLYNLVATHKA